jgi:hypothetical protein
MSCPTVVCPWVALWIVLYALSKPVHSLLNAVVTAEAVLAVAVLAV